MEKLSPDRIIGSRLTEIGHSEYSEPEFVIEGIGPARFRSHYLRLDSGVVADLFTAGISIADDQGFEMTAETEGLSPSELIGRTVTSVWCDDCLSALVILDHSFYIRDANDGATCNPLRAGLIEVDYSDEERCEFTDYFTELPV